MGLGGGAGALVSRVEGFSAKPHLEAEGTLDLVFPFNQFFFLGFIGGYREVSPSDSGGGYAYRGYAGGMVGALVELRQDLGTRTYVGTLRLVERAGIEGAICTYDATDLSFFFPSARFEAAVEFVPAGAPYIGFKIAIPARLDMRKDMAFSGSAGVRLSVSVHSGGNR